MEATSVNIQFSDCVWGYVKLEFHAVWNSWRICHYPCCCSWQLCSSSEKLEKRTDRAL